MVTVSIASTQKLARRSESSKDVLDKAVFLSSFAECHINNRQDRIAAVNNKKRGEQARPAAEGGFFSLTDSLNLKESIIDSAEEAIEAELRRQHREWKRLKKQEDEKLKQLKRQEDKKLKAKWRKHDKYDINGDGKPNRTSFKRWKRRKGAQQRFYERLRVARNAMYRNPLRELPTIPSSDSVQTLDKSRGTPIGEDHDNDIFAAIRGPLDSGDFDEQDVNDEAICELDLTPQVHSEEEPDLPPVPPSSPPLGRPP
ncbi:hypothetical protein E4U14_002638 [Claviceps sp. LM454 group G7]|nr:hypothetical protein E4U14_002638 [Claviceps sp. LM454 group G7]